jgi:signal transduction histidine kinase
MCQSIVSRIGGRIELDAAYAPGARFVVTLPLAGPARA